MNFTGRKELKNYDGFSGGIFSRSDITRLLVPLIAELLLSYLVGLADSVMVASAGEAAVSAVSLVDSISVLMVNIFSALAGGGAIVCGQYLGRSDEKRSRGSAVQLIGVLFWSSLAINILLLLFKGPLLGVLFGQADEEVRRNCNIYYSIVMCSVPFIALYNGGAAIFRTSGDSRTPMRVSVIMNIINIFGNALLIYVFHMGVAGVAIPTLVSRAAAMLIISIPLFRKQFTLNLRGLFSSRPDWHVVKNILSMGVPNALEGGMFQFGKLLLMSLVSTLGTASITANAIGNTVGNLHCVIGMAGNTALVAIVSRCAGAGDYKQARFYTSYLMNLIYKFQGIECIALMAAIPLINKIYGISAETAVLATRIMLIHGIGSLFLWPLAFVLNTAMRAAGDAAYAMIISSLAMWICRVMLSYIFILAFGCGVLTIWIVWLVDWLFRIAFFIPRWVGTVWETKAVK